MSNAHPIRKARIARRLSQAQLAAKVGVTKAAVSQWELGNKLPRPELARRMLAVLPRLNLSAVYAAAKPTQPEKEAA